MRDSLLQQIEVLISDLDNVIEEQIKNSPNLELNDEEKAGIVGRSRHRYDIEDVNDLYWLRDIRNDLTRHYAQVKFNLKDTPVSQ